MIKLLFSNINLCIGEEKIFFNRGTPQGSLISPILFNLYVNSLLNELQSKVGMNNVKAFADDIMFITLGINATEQAIQTVYDWAANNRMEVNTKKSQILQLRQSMRACHATTHDFIN